MSLFNLISSIGGSFISNISRPQTIIGLIIALLGFVLMFVSSKIARKVAKENEGAAFEKWKLVFKMIALAIVIIGCCIVMFVQ